MKKESQHGSKNTWIEIVAVPTGYIIQLVGGGRDATFVRKNIALSSAELNLLSDEVVHDLVCYTPK